MFSFQGKTYPYVDMKPNQTRVNERRVEIALGYEFLDKYKNVLEVGNVMRHYKPRGEYKHDVVDLNETNPNFPEIINKDILKWKPQRKYEAVLSISTLEHTGDPLRAVKKLISLAPYYLITLPVGYGKVSEVVEAYPDALYMRRMTMDNIWRDATVSEVKDMKYNQPFPYANALLILRK